MNKTSRFTKVVLLSLCVMFLLNGCKKKQSEMAQILFKKYQNKAFQQLDPEEFSAVFQQMLIEKKIIDD